jgi:hypothetical protein
MDRPLGSGHPDEVARADPGVEAARVAGALS